MYLTYMLGHSTMIQGDKGMFSPPAPLVYYDLTFEDSSPLNLSERIPYIIEFRHKFSTIKKGTNEGEPPQLFTITSQRMKAWTLYMPGPSNEGQRRYWTVSSVNTSPSLRSSL